MNRYLPLAIAIHDHGEPRRGWADEAACRGMDTDLFFPTGGGWVRREVTATCRACPVTLDCLSDAMRYGDELDQGIRAGIGTATRRLLRRTLREVQRTERRTA